MHTSWIETIPVRGQRFAIIFTWIALKLHIIDNNCQSAIIDTSVEILRKALVRPQQSHKAALSRFKA